MKKVPVVLMLGLFMVAQLFVVYRDDKCVIHVEDQPTNEHSIQSIRNDGNNTRYYQLWEANNTYFVRGKYSHTLSRLIPIEWESQSGQYNFYGVYFINCKVNPNFDSWIIGQAGKWPSDLDLYIEATSKDCENEEKLHAAVQLLKSSRPHSVTNLTCHTDQGVEFYEYYGIHKAWQLGQLHPRREDVIFYFHSKGITHCENYNSFEKGCQIEPEARATIGLIQSTGLVREVFDLFPSVAKLGLSYSVGHGLIWYNYWYARGSYINKTNEPVFETANRHYYEAWVAVSYQGARSDSWMCYSTFHTPNIGEYFDPNEWKYFPDPA